jgi:DNA-directed RNA polymerase subunit alpha
MTNAQMLSEKNAGSPQETAKPLASFDIRSAEPLSFAALEEGRSAVYQDPDSARTFERTLESLGTAGEEGRRRGMGWWVVGQYERCARELEPFAKDDTASYTRARALLALGRFDEAREIFERLTKAYPSEPRPRGGWLEARLESGLRRDPDPLALAREIEREIESAPGEFGSSVEGAYVRGRAAELRRDLGTALDAYVAGRTLDPAHRPLLRRLAHVAERAGFDDLAIQAYETLVAFKPAERSVLMNLGVLYEDVGRDADAASCYDIVVRNDPTDLRARLYLSDAMAAINMYYDEDLEKKEDRLNQILRIPITDFELSVRARNCLNKMQITTLGDLVQRTEQELLSYKNFGETSLTEIKEILHSKGLRLGMPREEAVASIEAHAARMHSGERSDVMNKPILELHLSIRARRTVETLGCLTVGDITKHSAEELLGMPNFGQTSLQELRSKLAELGLKLKGE